MAQINLGRIAFVNKGDWADGLHKVNDVVKYNNAIYACITEHTSTNGDILPTDITYWTLWVDENKWYLRTKLDTANIFRVDRFLATQDIASMVYDGTGNLIKIQYNNATDVDYEVLSYNSGDLSNVAHYESGILAGNTVLSYTNEVLTSAVFTGV